MTTSHRARRWALASATSLLLLVGCTTTAPEPCAELCDGIARCRQGNEACNAAGSTDYEPFYSDCVALCEASADALTQTEQEEALACLDCLRELTDFGACNGETLLDTTCATTCRSGGAIPFRNSFGPALFSAHDVSCLTEMP